jgi:hypothetical protein
MGCGDRCADRRRAAVSIGTVAIAAITVATAICLAAVITVATAICITTAIRYARKRPKERINIAK